MEKGVGAFSVPIQDLHGFFRGEDEQFNFVALSLTFDLIHNWQSPSPVPTTKRRHLHGIFSSRESGVCPKASRNFSGSLLHHVIAVVDVIDPNLLK